MANPAVFDGDGGVGVAGTSRITTGVFGVSDPMSSLGDPIGGYGVHGYSRGYTTAWSAKPAAGTQRTYRPAL